MREKEGRGGGVSYHGGGGLFYPDSTHKNAGYWPLEYLELLLCLLYYSPFLQNGKKKRKGKKSKGKAKEEDPADVSPDFV